MLRTLFFITVIASLSFLPCHAQAVDPPKLIGLLPIKIVDNRQLNIAAQLDGLLHEQMVSSRRMEIVERQFFSELENEKWRQSQVDFIDGIVISKTKSRGARHLIVGQITQSDVSRTNSTNGSAPTYSCDLKVSIRVVDIESTQVIISSTWSNGSILDIGGYADSEDKAMGKAVNAIKRDIKKFIEQYWPLSGQILQLESNGEALVNLGSANGISKNNKLIVFTTTTLSTGQSYNKDIGELKVSEVNGPEICTAAIRKGKTEIADALKNGVKLFVKTE